MLWDYQPAWVNHTIGPEWVVGQLHLKPRHIKVSSRCFIGSFRCHNDLAG